MLIPALLLISLWGCSKESESEPVTVQTRNPVYLDANGITVKANEWAKPGDKGKIDGIEYWVVDDFSIRNLVGAGISNLCTTRVTDMSGLFGGFWEYNRFNTDISFWDVSNVTTMDYMFSYSEYNKPIGAWDVSNVTSMEGMFWGALNFNQDLSAWDVANVQNCASFSTEAPEWQEPKPAFANCTD